jgi:hypothetical protein
LSKSAHQAALDQAQLLASYLSSTPTPSLDFAFIRSHLDDLASFAYAATLDSAVVVWADRPNDPAETETSAGRFGF